VEVKGALLACCSLDAARLNPKIIVIANIEGHTTFIKCGSEGEGAREASERIKNSIFDTILVVLENFHNKSMCRYSKLPCKIKTSSSSGWRYLFGVVI